MAAPIARQANSYTSRQRQRRYGQPYGQCGNGRSRGEGCGEGLDAEYGTGHKLAISVLMVRFRRTVVMKYPSSHVDRAGRG